MARNLRRFPPKPLRSANFMRSLAGSEPGLRMNTMGEFGVLCSKMDSKLIMGGCTYLVKETKQGLSGGQAQHARLTPSGTFRLFLWYSSAQVGLLCLHSSHTGGWTRRGQRPHCVPLAHPRTSVEAPPKGPSSRMSPQHTTQRLHANIAPGMS